MDFNTFVGQQKIKDNLKLLIDAAKLGREFPHLGLFGPAGCGKTTLAQIIANQLNAELIYINGAAVISSSIFRLPIVKAISKNGKDKRYVIMVDECHAIPKKIQNNLLSVLEKPGILCTAVESKVRLPNGRMLRRGDILKERLPENVSFIFCTTDKSELNDAMESRLHPINLEEYSLQDKCESVENMFERSKINLEPIKDAMLIANSSKNMRHLVKICERVIDYAHTKRLKTVSGKDIEKVLSILGIDNHGCDEFDKKYIKYVYENMPVSLSNISRYLNVPDNEVKTKIEPFLIRKNWINITQKGRILTKQCMSDFFKTQDNITEEILEILWE